MLRALCRSAPLALGGGSGERRHRNPRAAVALPSEGSHGPRVPHEPRTSHLHPRPRCQRQGPAAFLSSSLLVARPDIIANDSGMPALPRLVQGSTSWEHPWDPRAGAHGTCGPRAMGAGRWEPGPWWWHHPGAAPSTSGTDCAWGHQGTGQGRGLSLVLALPGTSRASWGSWWLWDVVTSSAGQGAPLCPLPWPQPWSRATRTQGGTEATWTH